MFRRFSIFALAVLGFTGIANAQVTFPSSTPVPDYYKGRGGVQTDLSSVEFVENDTVLEGKDTFVTFKIKHRRTGVLKNDVSFLDQASTIPAGTLMYAMDYGRAYDQNSARTAGGLAWCAVRDDKEKPICIFWDGTSRTILFKKKGKPIKTAAYVDGDKSQSKYYAPDFRIQVIEGGDIPIIEEKPIDFGRDFTVKLRFDKFKKDSARISGRFSDGEKEVKYLGPIMRFEKVKLNQNGEAKFKILGKNILLHKVGKKKARFEILNP